MLEFIKALFQKPEKDIPVYLVVGLGNPGDKYKNNRHNIGFMAMDVIAADYGFSPFRSKFQGQISEGRIGDRKIVLLKPETFMNNSGQSVAAAAKFFKMEPENIIIFHDELDLLPGKARVRLGGGNAGHNGLKSIQAHLGSPSTWRVRIGIGHPGDKNRVSGYVLSDFAKIDQDWVERLLPALSKNIDLLLQGKDSDYMSKVVMDCPAPTEIKIKKEDK
jgi:PTH1 family peptidyl-tRNA hydrolase